MSYEGSGSLAADDLVLTVSSAPLNTFGLIFRGDTAVFLPLGDGNRCSGGTIVRLPVQNTGNAGSFVQGPGIVAGAPPSARILPGQTWHFQAWYRDSTGPCGTGSNLSNGVAVTFSP